MCFPFFKAQGHEVGASLCEEEGLEPRPPRARGRRREAAPPDRPRRGAGVLRRHRDAGARRRRGARGLDGPRHRPAQARPGYAEVIRDAGTVFGTARWARSSWRRSRPARAWSPRPWPSPTPSPWSAAAIRGGARPVRARRPRHPSLHRRRGLAGADRGQDPPGRGGPHMSRVPFIAGNWKMHKSVAEARSTSSSSLLPKVAAVDGVEIVVCPPFLALQALVDSARGSQVGIYAQNMHEADQGAFTGRGLGGDADRDRRGPA